MGFNFSDRNNIRLDICGKIYSLPVTNSFLQATKVIGSGLKEAGESLAGNDDIDAVCVKCASYVDALLGDGASDEIFGSRERSIYDYIDLLTYILGEIAAFTNRISGKSV